MRLTEPHWPAELSTTIEETTVGSALRAAAERHGARPALVEGIAGRAEDRRRWTFGELLADAERIAGALLERFEPGERVAVWAPNIPEWVLLEFGAGLAGLVLVTVKPAYKPKEVDYVLRQSGASGIFLVPELRGNPMRASLEEVRPSLPDLREVVLFDDWDAFVATSPVDPKLPDVQPGDAAQIQYTSGTTGFAKGALLHHRGLTNNARIFASITGLQPGDNYLNPFPMFHTAGCVLGVLGTLQAGACHIPVHIFDPSLMLELAETEQADVLLGVPTVLLGLLECPDLATRDLSRVRVALSGGATVPADLVKMLPPSRSSSTAVASTSPRTRRRGTGGSSTSSPSPPPARSRSSCCAIGSLPSWPTTDRRARAITTRSCWATKPERERYLPAREAMSSARSRVPWKIRAVAASIIIPPSVAAP